MKTKEKKARKCERSHACLNFKRDGLTFCTNCGISINMDHFHDNTNDIRLCFECFNHNLTALNQGLFAGATTGIEPNECANYAKCFLHFPFELYIAKKCEHCSKFPLPQHFHDIHRNIRLCLECYINLRGEI